MSLDKLIIEWQKNKEIEFIDLDMKPGSHKITRTSDWWQWDKKFHAYNVRGESKVSPDRKASVKISYFKEDNNEEVEDSIWGEVRITVDPNQYNGSAKWKPYEGEPRDVPWRRIPARPPDSLFERKVIAKRSTISRDEMFRLAVLDADQVCALTGETTPDALDAAHIIPVSENGVDAIQNALLLRTDLHRLYDNNLFCIRADGSVEITEHGEVRLSGPYRDLLTVARVERKVLLRVGECLAYRNKIFSK